MSGELETAYCWLRSSHLSHRWERILGGSCLCPGIHEQADIARADADPGSPKVTGYKETRR